MASEDPEIPPPNGDTRVFNVGDRVVVRVPSGSIGDVYGTVVVKFGYGLPDSPRVDLDAYTRPDGTVRPAIRGYMPDRKWIKEVDNPKGGRRTRRKKSKRKSHRRRRA
jgi:hypothetical protein